MTFESTKIEGVMVFKPKKFEDERGYFFESYNHKLFVEFGYDFNFVQDNQSMSAYGTIRGLHFQKDKYAQTKLVRVLQGKILDVIVDIRRDSKTFGQHVAIELSAENNLQVLVPKGLAHGFSVLQDKSIISYKCDNFYNAESEGGIIYNDPALNIDWQIPSDKILVSGKDLEWQKLEN